MNDHEQNRSDGVGKSERALRSANAAQRHSDCGREAKNNPLGLYRELFRLSPSCPKADHLRVPKRG